MHIQFEGIGFPFHDRVSAPLNSKGCRAIIEQDDCILFSCLTKRNQFLLPGGRIDGDESLSDCVLRECWEELGMVVRVNHWLCSIEEQYVQGIYRNDYFVVDVKQQELPLQLVKDEILLKLAPVWVPKQKVLAKLLGTKIEPKWWEASSNLAIRHSHYREACALSAYFSLPLPTVPDYLKNTLLQVSVQNEEAL